MNIAHQRYVIYPLLYKNSTKKNIMEIMRILNISQNNLIYTKPNRTYNRIKKKPSSKWCHYGNKYKIRNK